jgi:hypothetical protein
MAEASKAWTVFKDRDDWIRSLLAVSADDLSYTAKIVGVRIAMHHNVKTGRCDPDMATLAAGTSMSDRNVRRMLRELEQRGWLHVEHRGYRRTNSFELLIPSEPETRSGDRTHMSAQRPDTAVRSDDARPDNPGIMTGQTGSNDRTLLSANKEKNSERKSEEDRLSPELDLDGDESGRRDQQNPSTADFEVWYRQYPKHVAKAQAAKAYRERHQQESRDGSGSVGRRHALCCRADRARSAVHEASGDMAQWRLLG